MLRSHLSGKISRLLASAIFVCASAAATPAQDTCDVDVHLDETGPFGIIAYGIDYSGVGGDFVGDSTIPSFGGSWAGELLACTQLIALSEYTALDDNAGLFSNFLADVAPPGSISGPSPLISCVFALSGGFPCPDPGDFAIVDATFPNDPVPPPIAIPSPPALSITVTPRTPVCGDGFVEGIEECDDGNTADGDCCSSVCTLDAAATPCDDGSVCTNDETCDGAGTCVVGSTLVCDDGVACTRDFCDAALGCQTVVEPGGNTAHGCHHLRSLKLSIRDHPTNDGSDRMKLNGRLSGGDIGDPTTTTEYTLCLYDRVGSVYTDVIALTVPAGSPWAVRGGSESFGYIDGAGTNGGITKMRLKKNKNNVGKFLMMGDGANLPLPGPFAIDAYMASDPSTAVQVETNDGDCWGEELGPPLKNSDTSFKVKKK